LGYNPTTIVRANLVCLSPDPKRELEKALWSACRFLKPSYPLDVFGAVLPFGTGFRVQIELQENNIKNFFSFCLKDTLKSLFSNPFKLCMG